MRKKSTLLKSLFLICLVPSITFAQISSPQIDSLVADALLKFKVAGAAVAVVKDGKVIHSKGYGLLDITTKQAVNESTNFQIVLLQILLVELFKKQYFVVFC
jgi:CubicO group peptidase (beta-lactamase class C family)